MAFSWYKPITVDHTQCGSSDSSNFPVAIWRVSDADFKTVAHGGYVQNANGYDIRPYADSTLLSALTFELVPGTYDGTAGTFEMHVKLSTLSHTSDTLFYLAFGDNTISTDGSSTSTWNANFKGVYHFPNGSSLTLTDSTSGANNLTNHGGSASAGLLDGADNLGAGGYATATGFAPISTGGSTGTISMWFKPSGWGSGDSTEHGFYGEGSSSDGGYIFRAERFTDNNWYTGWLFFTGGDDRVVTADSSTPMSSGNWYQIHLTWNSGTPLSVFYFDGASKGTHNVLGSIGSPTNGTLYLGGYNDAGTNTTLNAGSIDEVRVLSTDLGPDWVLAEYNNQKPSSTFLTWGSRTPVGGAGKLFRISPVTGLYAGGPFFRDPTSGP